MSFAQVRALDIVARALGVEDVARLIATRPSTPAPRRRPPLAWRPAAYALAVWVAAVDGRVGAREAALLSRFARLWDIEPDLEVRLNRLALGLATVAAGRPSRRQLDALLRASRQMASSRDERESAA